LGNTKEKGVADNLYITLVKIFEASDSKSSTDKKNSKNRRTPTAEEELDA
jgi:hypothetical protein